MFLCNDLINLTIINKNTMSLQPKNKNVRVLSAKIVQNQTERVRPLSGVPNQAYTRRQMIVNSYNSQGADTNRVQSAKITVNNFVSQNFQSERYVKKVNRKQTKQKEQMASQIMGLKQTINRLVQQLSMQKGKMQNMRKKNVKFSKLLTMQFQDEKQWNSNTVNNHLVSGIKNMYDTLKQKYQAKCQELDTYIKKIPITKELQNQQYITALEAEVKNLKKKMEKINEVNLSSAFTSQTQRHANQYVIADLQNEKTIITQKYKQLQKKYKQVLLLSKDQSLKIQIDKKLIDEKDNGLHALQRKNKQLNRQLLKIKQINLTLDQQLSQLKINYHKQVQQHQLTIKNYQQKCKNDVQSVTQIKNNKIKSLQEDNQYLHKMIQDLRSTNLQLNKNYQELKQQNLKNSNRNNGEYLSGIQLKKDKTSISKGELKRNNEYAPPFQNGKRIPQKADKKYHENAIKTRKIQAMQVAQIKQFIRLKLIAQQFSIEQVKKLFDYIPKQGKKGEWQKEYITMGEVKRIFTDSPFCLQEQDVLIISRYLIEDVQTEYVYCDDLNENHRQVVKSIMKNLIQQYPVYQDGSPQYYQMNQEIEKYGKNLKSALKSLTKDGIISKVKLLQAMKSIGMQIKTNIFQLIISKISLKSKNINELKYSTVF